MYNEKIMARFIIVSALIMFLLIIPALVQHCNASGVEVLIYDETNAGGINVSVMFSEKDPFDTQVGTAHMILIHPNGAWVGITVESYSDGDLRMHAFLSFPVAPGTTNADNVQAEDRPLMGMFDGGPVELFHTDFYWIKDGDRQVRITEEATGRFFNRIVHAGTADFKIAHEFVGTFDLDGSYAAMLALINEMGRRSWGTKIMEDYR